VGIGNRVPAASGSAEAGSAAAGNPHLAQPRVFWGRAPEDAAATVVLVHGRYVGGPSYMHDQVVRRVARSDLAYVAPTACDDTWYPLSFLAPPGDNEPRLTQALDCLSVLAADLTARGVPPERVIWVGFSQGACLVSEWVTRHRNRHGGVVAFTGGLMGPPGSSLDRSGDLAGMPVFLGTSDIDPFVPVDRVRESARVFQAMGADVDLRVYAGMGHGICDDEIAACRSVLDRFR
jgi:dienelactone hydrolase